MKEILKNTNKSQYNFRNFVKHIVDKLKQNPDTMN